MMTQTAQMTPEKEDIGFYARVPRIVRTGYPELSHAEKWLYTCLRDLCGEAGECWRSLRTLAEETSISIGSLCKMIPHLAKVGLIDAVMNGTWFIRIRNIWKANKEYCSKNEHVAAAIAPSVQILNSPDASNALPVQNLNAECSKNEQECSEFERKKINTKKIESEEDKEISVTHVTDDAPIRAYADGYAEIRVTLDDLEALNIRLMEDVYREHPPAELSTPVIPNVDTPSHIAVPISKPGACPPLGAPPKETRKRGSSKKVVEEIDISPEGMQVYRDWCSLFKVNVPLNKAIAKAANELVEPLAVWSVVKGCSHKEILKLIKNWLYENDKNGYYSRGVKLYDIAREFEGWQSKQEQPQSMNGSGKKAKPAKEEELVFWQGRYMTEDEANTMGFNGGFGAYVSQEQW